MVSMDAIILANMVAPIVLFHSKNKAFALLKVLFNGILVPLRLWHLFSLVIMDSIVGYNMPIRMLSLNLGLCQITPLQMRME